MELGRQFADVAKDVSYNHEHWEREDRWGKVRGVSVTADHPRLGQVGRMELSAYPDEKGGREIYDVGVMFKRAGIGRGLYTHAVNNGLNPVHSRNRTDEGDAWAKSVGGHVPERSERRY